MLANAVSLMVDFSTQKSRRSIQQVTGTGPLKGVEKRRPNLTGLSRFHDCVSKDESFRRFEHPSQVAFEQSLRSREDVIIYQLPVLVVGVCFTARRSHPILSARPAENSLL